MFFCGSLPLFLLKTGHSTKVPNSLPLVHLSSVFLLHEINESRWLEQAPEQEGKRIGGGCQKDGANNDK
jgi:hypothetical protein